MKKILSLLLVGALTLSMVACGSKNNGEAAPEGSSEVAEANNADVELSTVVTAIKDAYGEDYIPSMVVDDVEVLESVYGLAEDMYQEVFVEIPMISVHSDMLIAVKVAEGRQADVVAALNNYRDYLINDAMQYPMNQLKLQSSRVIEREGFVFFVTLGMIPSEVEGEEEIIAKAAELNDIAEKAIDSVLK